MKKYLLFNLFFFLLLLAKPSFSQDAGKPKEPIDKAKDCIEQYKTLSRLGAGYTREVSEDVIDQFRGLFERDAFLYWDLYRNKFDSIPPPLTLIEYIAKTKDVYLLKQPVLDYPKEPTYKLSEDNQSCIVYLVKTNTIMDENDQPIKGRYYTIRLRLNLRMNTKKEFTIQNIAEDKRNTLVRSFSPALNYIAWDNVASSFTNDSKSAINPLLTQSITATVSQQLYFGAGMDFRLNNEIRDGVVVMVGAYYGQVTYDLTSGSYERRITDTIDKASPNRFTLTVFDRSDGITEKLKVTSIEIPITIKKYLDSWLYVKGGLQLSLTTATSDVSYSLKRSGGGWLTKLSDPSQSRFLNTANELNIENYGFFPNTPKAFTMEQDISKIGGAVVLGLGLEKQFNRFSIGIEPNIHVGTNPLYKSNPLADLTLEKGTVQLAAYNGEYTGLLGTMELPAYRISAGVGFFISYLFKH
ncbi:MAG: hypothetical protein ACOYN4_01670 [Bacteroidales bacterium]